VQRLEQLGRKLTVDSVELVGAVQRERQHTVSTLKQDLTAGIGGFAMR
jgi:hypothetical protein